MNAEIGVKVSAVKKYMKKPKSATNLCYTIFSHMLHP
jgi:hypothetical protein